MCKPILDVQDEMHGSLLALEGLRDLLCEATGPGKREFDALGPDGLLELVDMVEQRFRRLGAQIDALPRGR